MNYTWSSSDKSVATVKKGVVKGLKAGTTTITVKSRNGKTDTFKVTVKKKDGPSASKKPGPTLAPGFIYDMTGYNADVANTTYKGYKCLKSLYSEYKYNYGGIWMMYASLYDGKKIDYRGKKIKVTGYYMHTGDNPLKEVCLAINATKPEAYPIIQKDSNVAPNVWKKVDVTFTLNKNAYNGDTDDEGNNYSIYLYYAWKTDNGDYENNDDFYFRDYKIQILN